MLGGTFPHPQELCTGKIQLACSSLGVTVPYGCFQGPQLLPHVERINLLIDGSLGLQCLAAAASLRDLLLMLQDKPLATPVFLLGCLRCLARHCLSGNQFPRKAGISKQPMKGNGAWKVRLLMVLKGAGAEDGFVVMCKPEGWLDCGALEGS